MATWFVRVAYWQQYVWFYLWKWSMPWPWLHIKTIRRVNMSRHDYLEVHRKRWPKLVAALDRSQEKL